MYLNNKALLENREEKNKQAKSYSTDKPLSPPPPRSSQETISRTVACLKNIRIQPARRAFSWKLKALPCDWSKKRVSNQSILNPLPLFETCQTSSPKLAFNLWHIRQGTEVWWLKCMNSWFAGIRAIPTVIMDLPPPSHLRYLAFSTAVHPPG